MEAVEVTARFDTEGKVNPVNFTWQGQTFPIVATGRRWQDAEAQHILVMVPGDQVYELVYFPSVGRWYMGSFGPSRRAA